MHRYYIRDTNVSITIYRYVLCLETVVSWHDMTVSWLDTIVSWLDTNKKSALNESATYLFAFPSGRLLYKLNCYIAN